MLYPLKLKHGKRCMKCRNTGYSGRTGIYEILAYTRRIKQLTTRKQTLVTYAVLPVNTV